MSLNHDLADLFKTAAAILEIRGEPVFKAIAFTKVARVLNDMTLDIKKAVEDGSIDSMEGVGKSSKKIIVDYVTTGTSPDFEELKKTVPEGLIPLLQIPSLGPKTIALFWKERNITSLPELEKALADGSLEGLPKIGEKKLQSIREGIALIKNAGGRKGIADVLPVATELLESVKKIPGVKMAQVAGSLRRMKETIGDVDIIAGVDMKISETIAAAFVKLPPVTKILGQGASKSSVLVQENLQVDLRLVPIENYGAALLYFTGSKEHNVRIRGLANDKGLTLNEWGLYKLTEYEKAEKATAQAPKLKPIASKTEADVYEALGLDYVEPELREDRGEVDLAAHHKLPKLITIDDIKGELHCHTVASDGTATIEEMALAAKALGYEYIGITDHSKSQVIANGLTADRLLKHVEAIHKAGEKIKGIKLLAGCEVDILADGSLDYGDDILKELDYVVASPHVALKQDAEKATARILRAIENKYVTIIGHPTGRLINARAGLPLDFEPIFKAAADTGTALEINAGWPRLDLDDLRSRAAIAAGVTLSINTDAHSTDGLKELALGISVARRAGAEAKNVLNCMTLAQVQKFITAKRKGAR